MHVRRSPPDRATRSQRARRVLAGALVVTGAVAVLGASGAVDLRPVRGVAAAALGPLERVLGPGEDEVSRARADEAALATRLAGAHQDVVRLAGVSGILAEPTLAGARLVAARVVAVGRSGPAGPERVTIDAGSRDGVEVDRTVVAAEGLVGRVVSVAPWTSDVLLVGAPDLAVGVRVGDEGVLGEASGSAPPMAARAEPGLLSLALVQRGTMTTGDAVTTLGSVGTRPFVPGIRVGTVHSVEVAAGRLAPTGTIAPAVDTTTLDVVAVVLAEPRSVARPAVTPTPTASPTGAGAPSPPAPRSTASGTSP
ncbi:MAG TPA: rod shape-determining protein MreC [Ornithinibacter sp.]|nr:rod shape-determining protein MreC [Ornithinibacter sp.]